MNAIKCDKFTVFVGERGLIKSVYIKCIMFDKAFYIDEEIKGLNSLFYEENKGMIEGYRYEEVHFMDGTILTFMVDKIDNVDIKSTKRQVEEYIKNIS